MNKKIEGSLLFPNKYPQSGQVSIHWNDNLIKLTDSSNGILIDIDVIDDLISELKKLKKSIEAYPK